MVKWKHIEEEKYLCSCCGAMYALTFMFITGTSAARFLTF